MWPSGLKGSTVVDTSLFHPLESGSHFVRACALDVVGGSARPRTCTLVPAAAAWLLFQLVVQHGPLGWSDHFSILVAGRCPLTRGSECSAPYSGLTDVMFC